MKNVIKYKSYTGTVHFDVGDEIFHGRVLGVRDVIGFEGNSVTELVKDFRNAIDDYLDTCKQIGKEPEKPFSGRFLVRIDPELHRDIALKAIEERKSLNAWIAETLKGLIEIQP